MIITKGFLLIVFISALLLASICIQKGNIPTVKASVQQGDLVISGNTVYTIEGRFDINGSIIVEENATLIFKNAVLNFTQAYAFQHNITLKNPAHGHPRLLVENVLDSSNRAYEMWFYGNSSVSISNFTTAAARLYMWNSSFASISNSAMYYIYPMHYSLVNMSNSVLSGEIIGTSNSRTYIYNSTINKLWYYYGNPRVWLVNSTSNIYDIRNQSEVYVCWYLNVHVRDSISQNVPSANATALYPNATVAESKLTDASGWAKLTLMEKMKNATGDYPVGNYTVLATYGVYNNTATLNMTGNQELTLALGFVIPEFPSFLIPPLFMIATLLAVIAYRKKRIDNK